MEVHTYAYHENESDHAFCVCIDPFQNYVTKRHANGGLPEMLVRFTAQQLTGILFFDRRTSRSPYQQYIFCQQIFLRELRGHDCAILKRVYTYMYTPRVFRPRGAIYTDYSKFSTYIRCVLPRPYSVQYFSRSVREDF